jgi:hypothetical protein
MNFPLYDLLASRVDDTLPRTNIDWGRYIATIGNMGDDHLQVIYLLMLHHATITGVRAHSVEVPYGGAIEDGGRGVRFQLERLPARLREIVYLYVALVVA